jgi:hypothetical protein
MGLSFPVCRDQSDRQDLTSNTSCGEGIAFGSQEVTVTHLRKMMLDELQRRNDAPSTIYSYIHAVKGLS